MHPLPPRLNHKTPAKELVRPEIETTSSPMIFLLLTSDKFTLGWAARVLHPEVLHEDPRAAIDDH